MSTRHGSKGLPGERPAVHTAAGNAVAEIPHERRRIFLKSVAFLSSLYRRPSVERLASLRHSLLGFSRGRVIVWANCETAKSPRLNAT